METLKVVMNVPKAGVVSTSDLLLTLSKKKARLTTKATV